MHSTHSHHQHDFDHVARIRARRGGFGPGGFGPGGPRGFGPGGPRGGKRRKRGEIRDAILQLLTDRPMHGYEMIQEIEERSDSRWSPSPGSVYPMLQLLEDEGLISHAELEGRKVFSLTTPGTAHVQEHLADRTPPWEAQEGEAQAPHHRMFHAGGQMMLAARQVAQVGDEEQVDAAIAVLERARRDLYGILAGDTPSDAGAKE